jgi:hypothetical protein
MQVLGQLSRDLSLAVLHAAPARLAEQLQTLPEDFHSLAVQAAFPSLSSHRSLYLDCFLCDTLLTSAALHAFNCVLSTRAPSPSMQSSLRLRRISFIATAQPDSISNERPDYDSNFAQAAAQACRLSDDDF